MKAAVVGSGGREHALVKALKRSSLVSRVFVWPGNDGILLDAEPAPPSVTDHKSFARWAADEKVDLVVIGPEKDLVEGLADELRQNGISVFGPGRDAAQLEASKIYAKQFMFENDIPTAPAAVVSDRFELERAATRSSAPYVLKADGLAAGKGVFICQTKEELIEAGRDLFERHTLGDSGRRALLEEYLPGKELSVLVLTNGYDFEILPFSRDHKRLLDNDEGPNTGGMGVIAPISIPEVLSDEIRRLVVEPSIRGLKTRNLFYRGILFIGVMLTQAGPRVLEYNVRWGDPEAQAILPLLGNGFGGESGDGDWADVFKQVADGAMPRLKWKRAGVACVVVTSPGYPNAPLKGIEISGLATTGDSNAPRLSSDVEFLHAGTKRVNNRFVTNGGRVLNVVATATSVDAAVARAYQELNQIHFDGMQFRRDIGK